MFKKNSMQENPYKDLEVNNRYIIREFSQDIDPIELMWHRDDEDRVIQVLECGEGWKFQSDNELPLKLKPNLQIFIARHEWHRVIKGKGNLLIKINNG